jgi:hypothetical protein
MGETYVIDNASFEDNQNQTAHTEDIASLVNQLGAEMGSCAARRVSPW